MDVIGVSTSLKLLIPKKATSGYRHNIAKRDNPIRCMKVAFVIHIPSQGWFLSYNNTKPFTTDASTLLGLLM
jgi:hypothetical protein